jgi:AcrR family transcriptional regulator
VSPPKVAPVQGRPALEPQRRPGRQRVAALLKAGADVIAERGFEAATMAEIAARAGAPIGSLYRFFPNKDALADALIRRYRELIDAAFARIDARRASTTTEEFADALLTSLHELRGDSRAVFALLEARPDGMARGGEFHDAFLRNISRTLQLRSPSLDPAEIRDMSVVLLQNMKTMKTLDVDKDAGTVAELRTMMRLYLAGKLGD